MLQKASYCLNTECLCICYYLTSLKILFLYNVIPLVKLYRDIWYIHEDNNTAIIIIVCLFSCRQVILVLSQLERMSPYHLSRRLLNRQDNRGSGLGDWAPPDVNHFPLIESSIESLHKPLPL